MLKSTGSGNGGIVLEITISIMRNDSETTDSTGISGIKLWGRIGNS